MMTDPMTPNALTPDRAGDIIQAYGGDSRRWPQAERDAVLAMIAGDDALRGEYDAAAAFDLELADWAAAAVASPRFDVGDLPARGFARWRLWGGGAALAASFAAGIVLLTPMPLPGPITGNQPLTMPVAGGDIDSFSYVFTPTDDEESLI